jgi:hypothetical protein
VLNQSSRLLEKKDVFVEVTMREESPFVFNYLPKEIFQYILIEET